MKITQETDYAFRITSFLASHENEIIGAPIIAEECSVTERFTLRILRKLNLAGITYAKRGAKGGYGLKRSKEEITLYQIICAIDGPTVINRCLGYDHYCNRKAENGVKHCKFHKKLFHIQKTIINMFDSETIDNYI